jgi:hypothetical protein
MKWYGFGIVALIGCGSASPTAPDPSPVSVTVACQSTVGLLRWKMTHDGGGFFVSGQFFSYYDLMTTLESDNRLRVTIQHRDRVTPHPTLPSTVFLGVQRDSTWNITNRQFNPVVDVEGWRCVMQ